MPAYGIPLLYPNQKFGQKGKLLLMSKQNEQFRLRRLIFIKRYRID